MKIKEVIYNCSTGKQEIIERDMIQEEIDEINKPVPPQPPTIEEKVETVEKTNVTQDNLIDVSLLATDEIYTMIEPLLSATPQKLNLKVVSKMVDFYAAMVIRGLKNIDEVPIGYREEVRIRLT